MTSVRGIPLWAGLVTYTIFYFFSEKLHYLVTNVFGESKSILKYLNMSGTLFKSLNLTVDWRKALQRFS